jgi:hypothetical protein
MNELVVQYTAFLKFLQEAFGCHEWYHMLAKGSVE